MNSNNYHQTKRPKPALLIILDGWGISPPWGGNAISMANTPVMDNLWKSYPHTLLQASGQYVGLPGFEMGNSEVGHLNIGAGQTIRQDISRINTAIQNKTFFKNPVLIKAITRSIELNSSLHLIGLLSSGGVHSHIDHLFALLDLAKTYRAKKVYLHIFTDGRDTDPMEGLSFVSKLQNKLVEIQLGEVATVSGRYYAMDRDNRWNRTQRAYDAIVKGEGQYNQKALSAISQSYAKGIYDEFIIPTVITKDNLPIAKVSPSDSVIFFNFRSDRSRQLTHAFVDPAFNRFNRGPAIQNLFFVTMTPYDYELNLPFVKTAFPLETISTSLPRVLSQNALTQLHIAETEKYAHITYFLNGNIEQPLPLEDRILIPSPNVATYDQKPEMSAMQICNRVIENSNNYDFIFINFANLDMVGHTGNMKATIRAAEVVDLCLGKIIAQVNNLKGITFVTADHGNAEQMINPVTSFEHTEHTINPVPLIIVSNQLHLRALHKGSLCNIAPTILDVLNIQKPTAMSKSLFDV